MKTTADRAEVVGRISSIVHIEKEALESGLNYSLLSAWRGNPRGVNAVVSDGLGSILPFSHSDDPGDADLFCAGRRYFAEKLAPTGRLCPRYTSPALADADLKEISLRALEKDLEVGI